MLINLGLKRFELFTDSADLFPDIRGVDGGITVTSFKDGYTGEIDYYINNKYGGKYGLGIKFFSNEFERDIYNNIFSKCKNNIRYRVEGNIGSLGTSEFGYNKAKHLELLEETDDNMIEPILVWAAIGFGKGVRYQWRYIEKGQLSGLQGDILKSRKVMISKVGVAITGNKKAVGFNGIPQIVDKNVIGENVLFIFPENDTDYELQLIKSYFMTKTVRFLMSITQKDLCVRGFENVPDYTFFIDKLNGELFTDEFLYKYFNFSEELIAHIERCVSEKKEIE